MPNVASTISVVAGADAATVTPRPAGSETAVGIEARRRVACDGKGFRSGDERFYFRAATYGTFRPREDGARFPERERIERDLDAVRDAGFTVVRTYTPPPDDLLDLAADRGLHLFPAVFYPDWRYLVGSGRREQARIARVAHRAVRDEARRLAGNEGIAALCLGNEIPADVVRWVGAGRIARVLAELAEVVREEDPELLVTYANYPTAEYLPLDTLDFLTFNVFLERHSDFRRYLTRLHHLAGDRPLVLGEIGLDARDTPEGEQRQAEVLDWQLHAAVERGVAGTCVFAWTDEWWVGEQAVEGWHFGLTRADRSPRPALDVAAAWNERTVADLDVEWPSISVVICAHNAAATLDECLAHACALDYPDLEVIVVDDGSTDATAAVAARHPRARLVSIEHGGLSVARNVGFQVAGGKLIAYLDADAYPGPEWPYYLVLGLDGPMVSGVGGPSLPPPGDPPAAQLVARAPGGPVHVLVSDDRAEHVPGCNMAFWRAVLEQVGGFDPVYTAAGDDVDLCWKVLDRGWEIGFHPAAFVWHHRRAGLRAYLRQQWGYGRAEALVEARHPDRFTAVGTARWQGRIYDSLVPPSGRQRVYRGLYGAAEYQSGHRSGGHALHLAHQAGVPVAAATLLVGLALAPVARGAGLALAGLALAYLAALAVIYSSRAAPPRRLRRGELRFRLGLLAAYLLQPLVRTWCRLWAGGAARRGLLGQAPPFGPVRRQRGVLVLPAERPRAEVASAVVTRLRAAGLRVVPATGWEAHDARVLGSALIAGDLLTSAYPEGCVQLRMRRRPRRLALVVAAGAVLAAVTAPALLVPVAALALADVARGWSRTGAGIERALREEPRGERLSGREPVPEREEA